MSTTTMGRTTDRGGERAGARGAGVRSLAWRLVDTTRSVAPTVARLGLGSVMFAHGAQKALGIWGGYGFSGTMGFFTSKLGIPAPLAALAIIAEFFGSIALLFGFLTRVAAAGIGVVMLVAMAMVHSHVGFFMNWNGNQKGEGFEYHLLALTLCLVLLVAGGGSASIDRWLTERRRRPATL